MNDIRFNINLFEIDDYQDWYKHYFIFLIRYFTHSKNFSWMIRKSEFIEIWQNFWFSKRNLENIYQKWKKDNKFIKEIRKKWKNQLIFLNSIFNEWWLLVYIEKELIAKIQDINYFRSFCYMIIASRPLKTEKSIKKGMYEYKNPSRIIKTIWTKFWDVEKSTMSKRLKKAKELFSDYFNITNRYSYFEGFIVQLSNLYSIKWVVYVIKKDKRNKYKEFSGDFNNKIIKNKFIKKDRVDIFWDKPKQYKWFLDWDLYEFYWERIKEKVFK